MSLLKNHRVNIKGIANITGSGFLNIPRINDQFDYYVNKEAELPLFMKEVCDLSDLDTFELHRTFNMGVGMVIATDHPEVISRELGFLGEKCWQIGEVKNGSGKIFFKGKEL
jgi:phosphoribosylformylglycinamidine cyclo-ligase